MKKETNRMGSLVALNWIFIFIKPYKGWFIFSVLMSGGVIATNLLKAYFIQNLIDHSLDGQLAKVIYVVITFSLVILGGGLFSHLATLATGKFSIYALRDLKDQLADHLSQVQLKSLGEVQSGDMASRLNNDTDLVHNFIKSTLPTFSVQVLLGIGAALYVFFVNWKLLLVSILFLPFGMYMAYYLNKHAGKYYPESYKYFGEASGEVEQSLIGIDIIKAFTLKGLFSKKIRKRYEKVFQADIKAQKYVSVLQPVCYSIANFPGIIAIIYGGHLATKGEIGIGTLIGVIQLYEYIIVPAVLLPFVMNRIQQSIAAIERIAEVFSLPKECSNNVDMKVAGQEVAIRFEDVSFGYGDLKQVLKDLSFDLFHLQMTALVGASGGGKSTITNLICGLYEASQGKIELFGSDLRQLNLKSIREQITVVSQDTYLFPATIGENIMYGRPDASMEDVIRAAKAAFAHEFIEKMPTDYDTMIGEGGMNLSGGQKQRISIARAFLKDAPILILDEPTASLDHYSETLIQRSIEKLTQGRTVLVIAHRLSTIFKADQIIVLEDGQIVETGTHQQLVSKRGFYYRLYNSQFTA